MDKMQESHPDNVGLNPVRGEAFLWFLSSIWGWALEQYGLKS